MFATPCHQGHSHVVQFYDNDQFLADDVADFIMEGLWLEESAIVIATANHRVVIEGHLQGNGVDIGSAHNRYLGINAEEALADFMAQGSFDPGLFQEKMRQLIGKVARPGKRIRIFGEMVALLWDQGNREAAMEIEALWNEFSSKYSFSTLCGYRLDSFRGQSNEKDFRRVCELHSGVIPLELFHTSSDVSDSSRSIALLQQRSLSLDAEIGKRKRAESAAQLERSRLKMAFDLAGIGVWEMDLETRRESWSDEAKAIFGVDTDEAFSCQQMLQQVHAQDRNWIEKSLQTSLETGVDFCEEFRVSLSSNEVRWVSVLGRRFQSERDCFYTLCLDVTEKNQPVGAGSLPILENIPDDKFLDLIKAIRKSAQDKPREGRETSS